jgi:CheY-like chemotaxis protein
MVIEREYPGNISARKLVIETAKMNVITCYSSPEAIETLRRFPDVNGIVLTTEMNDAPWEETAKKLKSIRPKTPLVIISPNGHDGAEVADRRASSHEPQQLLDVLQELSPAAAA